MISDTLQEAIDASFCAQHHVKGDHERGTCPLPEGYCQVIGQLATSAQRLEQKNQKLRSQAIPATGGVGGSAAGGAGGSACSFSSSGAVGGAGGGAGRGY